MNKKIKMCPATKFIVWCILGLLICIIGISNVFADTYSYNQFTAQLYDNFGPTLSAVTTTQTNGRWQGAIPTMTANSSGAAWGISSNMALLANHTYTLTAEITGTYGGVLVLSSYNRIGIGTTLSNAKTSYQNNTYVTENYSRVLDNGSTLQFAFTPTTNGSYIVFPFATNYTGSNQYFYLSSYTLDDLGASGGVSQSDINNSLNSQTATLNQSITNSQNAITSNSDNNRDLIIQNQDENSINQIIADANNSRQQEVNSCSNAYMFNMKYGYTINSSNTLVATDDAFYTEDYITIHSDVTQLTIKNGQRTTGYYILVYDTNKSLLNYWYSDERTITLPSGSKYFRIVNKNANVMLYDGNKGCVNRVGAIQDSITDDNVDSSSWSNFFNNFTTNTFGLTSIITAPLNLIQSLTNTTCTDLQIPLPYLNNKYLTLPCMTSIYSQYFGSFFTLYQSITYGIIAYWVCVRIFNLVKDFKNPDHDEIEVVDL